MGGDGQRHWSLFTALVGRRSAGISRLVNAHTLQTYGDALVDEILSAQPDALIWDTNEHGRPDLVKLAYDAYKAFDAEAVICISNKKLTWQVVYGLESRGIPAYGAIWDS